MAKQEKEIPGILVVTHGDCGKEIIKSAEMIIGTQKHVKALSLLPGIDPEEFLTEVQKGLEGMADGSLVMSDLFGGTPSNVSAALIGYMNIAAVTGINLAMFIEAIVLRCNMAGEELAEAVLKAGREGCKNVGQELKSLDNVI